MDRTRLRALISPMTSAVRTRDWYLAFLVMANTLPYSAGVTTTLPSLMVSGVTSASSVSASSARSCSEKMGKS